MAPTTRRRRRGLEKQQGSGVGVDVHVGDVVCGGAGAGGRGAEVEVEEEEELFGNGSSLSSGEEEGVDGEELALQRPPSPLLQWALAQVLGNVVFYMLCFILYLNFILFKDYLWTILWSFVISQALQSAKRRMMYVLKEASTPRHSSSMLAVMGRMVTSSLAQQRKEGPGLLSVAFEFVLDNGISLFALVGALSLLTHLVPHWFLATCCLALFGTTLVALYVIDRRIFFYRKFFGDDEVAALFSISLFFLSVGFIIVFLGTESVLEGVSAATRASRWIQTQLEDEDNKQEWEKAMGKATTIASDALSQLQLSEAFRDSAWWPAVNATVSAYMESQSTLLQMPENDVILSPKFQLPDFTHCVEGGYDIEAMFWGAKEQIMGLFHGLDFNFDAETVWGAMGYAGLGGKVLAAVSLETLQVFTGTMSLVLGFSFKSLLFFVSTFYMTSHGDFVERIILDLLPIPDENKQLMGEQLRKGIEGVLFLPCKIACFHGIVTLGTFTMLGIEFPFFATFLCVLVSVLPVVPAWLVCVPWAVLHCAKGDWLIGMALFLSQYLLLTFLDNELCSKGLTGVNPFLTGLSIFLGYAVFGIQGVLLGPLIICMATLIHSFLGYMEATTSSSIPLSPVPNAQFSSPGGHRKAGMSRASSKFALEPLVAPAPTLEVRQQEDEPGELEFSHRNRASSAVGAKRRHSERFTSPTRQSLHQSRHSASWIQSSSPSRLGGMLQRMLLGDTSYFSSGYSRDYSENTSLGGTLNHHHIKRTRSSSMGERHHAGSHGQRDSIRIKLRIRNMRLEESGDDNPLLYDDIWRMDVKKNSTWEEFLEEAASVAGLPHNSIEAVFSVEGERITKVALIDPGEILYLAPY